MTKVELERYQQLLSEPSEESYRRVLELLMEKLFAERGCLWIEKENRFIYEGDEELRKSFPFSRKAVDAVLDQGRSIVSFDTETILGDRGSASMVANKMRSCLCAASRDASGEVILLVYFDNSMTSDPFSEEDLEHLKMVLAQVPGSVS